MIDHEKAQKTRDNIAEKIAVYCTVLELVAERVPVSLANGLELSSSDRKDIATSIFIELNMSGAEQTAKEPASDAQKTFVSNLLSEKGKMGETWFASFLESLGLENGELLTKEQASKAITGLKAL